MDPHLWVKMDAITLWVFYGSAWSDLLDTFMDATTTLALQVFSLVKQVRGQR